LTPSLRSAQVCKGLVNLTNWTNLATGHLVRLLMPQALIRYIGATISESESSFSNEGPPVKVNDAMHKGALPSRNQR
jgi:hypothetical protein